MSKPPSHQITRIKPNHTRFLFSCPSSVLVPYSFLGALPLKTYSKRARIRKPARRLFSYPKPSKAIDYIVLEKMEILGCKKGPGSTRMISAEFCPCPKCPRCHTFGRPTRATLAGSRFDGRRRAAPATVGRKNRRVKISIVLWDFCGIGRS